MDKRNAEIASIEQEQRRLADRLALLRKEPESVKPDVCDVDEDWECEDGADGFAVNLIFRSKEQAEKAKAILEKMEFGHYPENGVEVTRTRMDGTERHTVFDTCLIPDWRMGLVKVRGW